MVLNHLANKSESFVKESGHFVQLLKSVNLRSLDTVSLDAVSVLPNVPVNEALQVIRNRVHKDHTLAENYISQAETFMELMVDCFKTTNFQEDTKLFQQKHGMAMRSFLSPIISNIVTGNLKMLALDDEQ
jgi:hypothetical protein